MKKFILTFKKIFSLMRLKMAWRSISRHRLRSFLSIGMIAGAVVAIILFRGLTSFFLETLKEDAAETQFGNMQIAKEKFWSPEKENVKLRMFNLNEINDLLKSHPEIIRASGRLSFYGLINNGDFSVAGKFIGIDIIKESAFAKNMTIQNGKFFDGLNDKKAMVGALLAKQMNVKPGDEITVLTTTVDGVMNAMDLTVSGIFSTSLDQVDSQVVFIPLLLAQSILDTKNVDIAILKFTNLNMVDSKKEQINQELLAQKTLLKARSWKELAILFRQVENFYNTQNLLVESILLVLMFLGILNAVSMTVVERTGEIGTLRSFGESRTDIIGQFLLESLILTLIATIIGALGSAVIIQIFHQAHFKTELPGSTVPLELDIYFLFSAVLYALCLALVTTMIATYIPARRAAKMNIVDALRKNI